MTLLSQPPADRHSLWEDALGLVVGTCMMALAVMFLTSSALITGQIAGLSLIVSYAAGWSFGAVFFVLNLPFYILAVRQMGWRFTLRTFAAVGLLSLQTEFLPTVLRLEPIHPLVSAVLFGLLAGLGLIVLFRHGATLGGVGIVALWLQDTRGIPAGNVQLGFDLCVFVLALAIFDWLTVAVSLTGAVILNLMVTINHRRDRYVARS
ncbi:membrane protein [Mameliella alba]|uniref:YitT family protein n=1 Tax=Mameliella TaxID=1434019 RepID=UPI000B536444|nr:MULTISPECIES: YitT family protein [Mameliella]MBV6634740.1 YitT family protein [Mameliella sp.]MCR9272172.1 YitT family protein [Paracoccaceae bacterium]OWV62635.1 membrane protein [Mameliella alba]BBU56511.1 membrane protein [Mameliella alba]